MGDASPDSFDQPFQYYAEVVDSSLDSTGDLLVEEEVPAPAAVDAQDHGELVYGLGKGGPDSGPAHFRAVGGAHLAPGRKGRVPPVAVAAVLVAAVALTASLVVARLLPSPQTATPPKRAVQAVEPREKEPAPAPALSVEQVKALATTQRYAGEDVASPAGETAVEVAGGRVFVTRTLAADAEVDPAGLVRTSSRQAAALACALYDQSVTATGPEGAANFEGITWIVRNSDGAAFLAVAEAPSKTQRTSDGDYGLIRSSVGYVISPDLLDALGEESGLQPTGGEAPTAADGTPIVADATLPGEEAAEEVAPVEDEGDTYSYETTYDDYYYYDEGADSTGGGATDAGSGDPGSASGGASSGESTAGGGEASGDSGGDGSGGTDSGGTDTGGSDEGGTDSGEGGSDAGGSDASGDGGGSDPGSGESSEVTP